MNPKEAPEPRARIVAVTVRRAEGRIEECGTWTYEGEDAEARADERLRDISRTAPKDGSYHKCDVTATVELPDGTRETVRTRHDVEYLKTDGTVRGHVLRFLDYYAAHARREPPGEREKAARLADLLRGGPPAPLRRKEGATA
ncbi:MAG: hypothetical protein QXT68_07320 [Halobacteria archaeon]